MTATVVGIEPRNKGVLLVMSEGPKVWTPEADKAQPLVGHPIPADWTMTEGEYGPRALPPRAAKDKKPFSAAWKNTEQGEHFVQERMDRRTAAMQAVALINSGYAPGRADEPETALTWSELANDFYAWLRASAGSFVPSTQPSAGGETPEGQPSASTSPGPGRGEKTEAGVSGTPSSRSVPGDDTSGSGSSPGEAGQPGPAIVEGGVPSPGAGPSPHQHHFVEGRDGWLYCNVTGAWKR